MDFALNEEQTGPYAGKWEMEECIPKDLWPRIADLGFCDLNRHRPDALKFYTCTKTVTARWPSGIKEVGEFSIPVME